MNAWFVGLFWKTIPVFSSMYFESLVRLCKRENAKGPPLDF